jgi:predicted nuclease of predicted toxin-antitoxin system
LPVASATDAQFWDYAAAEDFAIVTKDEDFAQGRALSIAGPRVVWVRLPNTRRWELLAWFADVLPHLAAALERGETLVELV